ncbi:GAF domain-containing protein [Desulfococcus sp.]|uniref:GAF domain-containing protein n=1 Tax=Desulfococcus sp. TaxID=2025834 RepID=UPI003592F8AE
MKEPHEKEGLPSGIHTDSFGCGMEMSRMILSSAVPTFAVDRRHRVTHFNRACENLTGIRASDIIGTRRQWQPFYAHERPIMADLIIDRMPREKFDEYYRGKYRPSRVIPGAYEAEDFFPDLGEEGKWLFFTAAPLKSPDGKVEGAIVTLQDITRERQAAAQNQAMLRISLALPEHRDLGDLLDYISSEVRALMDTEGALVILLDEHTKEYYFGGSSYGDADIQKRVKGLRFDFDQIAAVQVIRTGKPIIINNIEHSSAYPERDRKLGYRTRNLIEIPIQIGGRTMGVLAATNRIEGKFTLKDVDLLNTIAGTVAISIENARISDELKRAYEEVSALNQAKDRAINHLSHELKTPVSILGGALGLLEDALAGVSLEEWQTPMGMIRRNLRRIADIQAEVDDIMKDRHGDGRREMAAILEQYADQLALIAAEEAGKEGFMERVRGRLREAMGLNAVSPETIHIVPFVKDRVASLTPLFSHREVRIRIDEDAEGGICMPKAHLEKIVDGLIRNAVENTPDEGEIVISITEKATGILLAVHDFGVGIPEAFQPRIFEGLFPVQDPKAYSTGKPFDFNAGGKGLDLLRIRIFSERYGFGIHMNSRCCPLARAGGCPGRISRCGHCTSPESCTKSGETRVELFFPTPRECI